MTKSSYLSSASKYFAIVSGLILLPNLFSLLGNVFVAEQIISLTSKATSFSFYLIIVLSYIALNGEGIAYRKNNLTENLKRIVYLKRYLLFSVVINFSKNFIERKVLSFSGNEAFSLILKLSTSLLFSAASFSFLVAVVLIWYFKRDKKIEKLAVIEIPSIAVGFVYNIFKALNYSVSVYGVSVYGKSLSSFFSRSTIEDVLCVICCVVFIVAFIVISKKYDAFFADEEAERKRLLSLRKSTKDIYKEEGYGIDTVEDDFILSDENL